MYEQVVAEVYADMRGERGISLKKDEITYGEVILADGFTEMKLLSRSPRKRDIQKAKYLLNISRAIDSHKRAATKAVRDIKHLLGK